MKPGRFTSNDLLALAGDHEVAGFFYGSDVAWV